MTVVLRSPNRTLERLTKLAFFREPSLFRRWLEKHHATAEELWVGYHKKDSGRPSLTWPESVDEALCFGWIDGLRKSVNGASYAIRFTPRRAGSTWSAVNIGRAQNLIAQGRMQPAGLAAYEARREHKSGIYSYEQRILDLPEPYRGMLKDRKTAWEFFQGQPPSYRRTASWWISSAKREATRLGRLRKLIRYCAVGHRLPEWGRQPKRVVRGRS
jgi:uncharacterized protein YdeI (YjbR/CyaY-like superfamily)